MWEQLLQRNLPTTSCLSGALIKQDCVSVCDKIQDFIKNISGL